MRPSCLGRLALVTWLGLMPLTAAAAADDVEVRFRGQVVDEQKVPAPGVEIALRHARGVAEAKTDDNGAFELLISPQAARGRLLRAAADGGRRQAFYQIPWDVAQAPDAIELRLNPVRRIEAHVNDRDGKPVEGVTVGIMASYALLETALTDAAGEAVVWTPADADVQFVFALSREHGVDYRSYVLPRDEAADRRAAPPELPQGAIELVLDGARRLRVRVVEPGEVPVAGVQVYPWLLKKPSETDQLNVSFFPDLAGSTTDNDGFAEFAWLPSWQSDPIVFWHQSKAHVHQRATFDPSSNDATLTITLDGLVSIRGRVTEAAGGPASGVTITASGRGYAIDDYRGTTVTDDEGRYELNVAPNMVYLIVAQRNELAGEPQTGFAVMPGQPVEDLDFKLRPATRVFGRVTIGAEASAVAGQRVDVYQYGQDANNMKDVVLPNPDKSNMWVQPIIVRSATTDEDGQFELWLGPGKYDVRGPQQAADVQMFEISDQSELKFDFHSDRPERGLLRGLITADEPAEAVGARVTGIYRHQLGGLDLVATTGDEGKFEVERELHRTVLCAKSASGKLAGVAEIGPDDKLAVIHLRPMVRAVGRLVDGAGAPLPGKELKYGTRVHLGDDDAPFRTAFGGVATTDEAGRFVLEGIVQELPYEVSVTIRPEDAPQQISWRRVAEIQAVEAQDVELGDVTYTGDE